MGEYHFKTSKSVQITHGIETVVKRLKYEALGRNQQVSESVTGTTILAHDMLTSSLPPTPYKTHVASCQSGKSVNEQSCVVLPLLHTFSKHSFDVI